MGLEELPVQDTHGSSVLRFEARWLKEKDFRGVVQGAWEASEFSNFGGLAGRLALVHDRLHRWDRSVLKSSKNKIKNC